MNYASRTERERGCRGIPLGTTANTDCLHSRAGQTEESAADLPSAPWHRTTQYGTVELEIASDQHKATPDSTGYEMPVGRGTLAAFTL